MQARLLIILVAVLLASVADAHDSPTKRRALKLPETEALGIPISDAMLVGHTLYLSGNGGIDFETMSVPDDPKDEARLLMENVKDVLELAGMTLDDLVSVTIYCPDLSLYGDFNEVYSSYFDGDYPARAFVGSGELLFGMRFEIQAIAVR